MSCRKSGITRQTVYSLPARQATQPGGNVSLASILGLLKSLKIRTLESLGCSEQKEGNWFNWLIGPPFLTGVPKALASPKSASLMIPSPASSRLEGFRSRWKTRLPWQYDNACIEIMVFMVAYVYYMGLYTFLTLWFHFQQVLSTQSPVIHWDHSKSANPTENCNIKQQVGSKIKINK